MKFLVDEYLSLELVPLAHAPGHGESPHVLWIGKAGAKGQYSKTEIHAGLVCLIGPAGMDLDMQLELFEVALDELAHGVSSTRCWKSH